MECGTPQSAAGPSGSDTVAAPRATEAPVATRRVTSVLFGDLVGFTSLSEVRDQEEVRELLSRYFDECRQIISMYGGTVEKFIGDAVMAVWGVPTAHEDDAERAVRAGLELVKVVAGMGEDLAVTDLAVRVGIVTGEVAVTIGAEQQGMVAGDAVNTASRVQSAAAPGEVWVDETTRLLTSAAITYQDAGSHALKGKAEPMPLWSVRAVVAAVGGAQRADGLEAPLIGRERELRRVKELFHSVEESGQPALLLMVGEPGVGKSRLAWEFEKYVDGLSSITTRWHSGRCVAYGEGVAFYALSEAIRARLRTNSPESDEDETPDDTARMLKQWLDRFVPDEQERGWLGPRVGALLGIGSVGTFPREDLFSAWTVFLQRVGEGDPVVLVIDDVHHADAGLLQFVEHLLAVASFPCFVVLLTRPGLLEEHPSLATNRRATISHLPLLREDDIAALLDGLVAGLPVDVRDALVARSEGVPLFAVETVRSLIDRDLVVPRGGQYVLADVAALDLDSIGAPASLQALIAARLDALDPAQRRLVDRASVVGTVFSQDQIAQLCPDLEDLDSLLSGLVHLQILARMASRFSADFGNYQFVQSVVRQVAYGTLSRRDRRATHLAVAGLTEAVDDSTGDLAPIIAQHYLDAVAAMPAEPDVGELEERAIEQLERAAVRSRSLGATTEAAGHLTAALERAKDPATRARLDAAVARALFDAGDFAQALVHAAAAIEAFDSFDEAVSAGDATATLADSLARTGDTAGATAVALARWEALLEEPGADRALLRLGKAFTSAAQIGPKRRDVLDRRIQLAEKVGDVEHLSDALTALSASYMFVGASETARALMDAAADLAREHHLPAALARNLINLMSMLMGEDLARALEVGREALQVAERAGVAVWRAYVEANLRLTLFGCGEWAELEGRLAGAESNGTIMELATEAGTRGLFTMARGQVFAVPWAETERPASDDPAESGWISFACGCGLLAEGRTDAALDEMVRGLDLIHLHNGISDDFVFTWPLAVEVAITLGDEPAVGRLLAVVDDGAARVKLPRGVRAHRARFAGLLAMRSDLGLAEQSLRVAVEGFATWGQRPYGARAELELASLLSGLGREDEAAVLRDPARALLEEIGAEGWLSTLDSQRSLTP